MSAERRVVRRELDQREQEQMDTAASLVCDIENEAFARGWAAGIDSTAQADRGMFAIAYGAVAIVGAMVGVLGTLIALRW